MLWRAGEKIGQYEIISELGRGGMATVYKAHHSHLDRHVAIKVMHQSYADDDSFIERFNREARIVASLEHPHIVPVYDYNEYNGMPYLVMKFVQGRSLKQLLFKKPPSLDEIIRIMTAIGQATTYAHNKGVLHRDIKPSNIIIDQDNVPYLADFGLARIVAAGESTMSADVLLGTPNYMSPEQARGSKDIDHRSDLYSLGIVLYELVVGQVPFSSQTPLAVIQDHINTPLPRPSQINPDIPPQVERVLRKALSKIPNDRYNSADDMLTEFQQAVETSGLDGLTDDRSQIANDSLARWRDAYIQHDGAQAIVDDNDSIAQSIRNLASPSYVEEATPQSPIPSTPYIEKSKHQVTTGTLVRNEPNGRYWILAGAAVIAFSIFLIVSVILNTSNTFLEIADIMQDLETNTNANVIDDTTDALMYDLPTLSLADAQDNIDDEPENPLNHLILADAQYKASDIDSARETLKFGYELATDKDRYLANAVSIADDAGDNGGAMIYGILLWDTTQNADSIQEQNTHTIVSEYLYSQSLDASEIQLSRNSVDRLSSFLGDDLAQQITRSHITRILITNNHIEKNRSRLAGVSLQLWTDDTYDLAIGQLVNARYDILQNDHLSAISQLNRLVETSTTPTWIVTIAQDLLISLED